MANFGAHRYYKVVVEAVETPGNSWYLNACLPMVGGLRTQANIYRDMGAVCAATGVCNTFYNIPIVTAAGTDATDWGWIVKGYTDSWSSSFTTDSWGSVDFGEDVYAPIWYMYSQSASTPITQLSLYYSDDNSIWNLAKTLTNASGVVPPENGAGSYRLEFGEVFDVAILTNSSSIPKVSSRIKALSSICEYDNFGRLKGLANVSNLPASPIEDTWAKLNNAEWRMSGGSVNTDPDASLGGVMSSTQIHSQIAFEADNIPGVVITSLSNNARGFGYLEIYTDDTDTRWISWKPNKATIGGSVAVRNDGDYMLLSEHGASEGYLCITATLNSLPEDGTYRVYVDNGYGEILSHIPTSITTAGAIEYRCIYLYNNHGSRILHDIILQLSANTQSITNIEIGIDPTPIGQGAVVTPDINTAPAGVVFSSPDKDSPLTLGSISFTSARAIWIKRTVPKGISQDIVHDISRITYRAKSQ